MAMTKADGAAAAFPKVGYSLDLYMVTGVRIIFPTDNKANQATNECTMIIEYATGQDDGGGDLIQRETRILTVIGDANVKAAVEAALGFPGAFPISAADGDEFINNIYDMCMGWIAGKV